MVKFCFDVDYSHLISSLGGTENVVIAEILGNHVFQQSTHPSMSFVTPNSARRLILQLAVNQPALTSSVKCCTECI